MQINGINSGPTMAASEPPEPPPRNPDRINASLHKLSESKTIKSLDSTVNKDKLVNNNRPIKPLLSLDNSTPTAAAASLLATATGISGTTSLIAAPTLSLSSSSSSASSSSTTAAGTTSYAGTTATATPSVSFALPSTSTGLHYNKRVANDLTPSGDTSSSSPHSSNGSNQTLTSPMTIDNQSQQQLQQIQHQQRLAYANSKSNSEMLQQHQQQQQQQQQQNGALRCGVIFGEKLGTQQSQSQQQQQHDQFTNGSSNFNLDYAQSNNTFEAAAVDKRNANDVSSFLKLMSSDATYSLPIRDTQLSISASSSTSSALLSQPLNLRPLHDLRPNASPTMMMTTATSAGATSSLMMASSYPLVTKIGIGNGYGNVNGNGIGNGYDNTSNSNANGSDVNGATMSNSCDGNRNTYIELKFNDSASFADVTSRRLREENERLSMELNRLRKVLENSTDGAVGGVDVEESAAGDGVGIVHEPVKGTTAYNNQRIDRLEADLRFLKNQLMNMRLERKKLRIDKSDLLSQVKQLCASLQEKEQELRDFIRNYQERVREAETNNAKLNGDRDRERFQLLQQARDEAERSLALAHQLSARDIQLQRLQEQLQEARRQLTGCMSDQESLLSYAPLTPPSAASGMLSQMAVAGAIGGNAGTSGAVSAATANSNLRSVGEDSGRGNSNSLSAFSSSLSGGSGATVGDRNSCSNDSMLRNNSDRESTGGELNLSDGACETGPCITVDPDSISLVSSQNLYQYGTPKERSPTLSPLNTGAYSRSVEQLGSPVDSDGAGASGVLRKFAPKTGALSARTGRGGTWGSISRVFARSRNKSKALSADGANEYMDYSWSPLSEEGYAEKMRQLREASQLPMERWRVTQVIAWLEIALGMPQYSVRCAENVKSGKVLLELNDIELEAGLGLVHPMHRKKLRLAIEEQRRPELVRYQLISQLSHTWVAAEWLPDIGLPQYAEPFLQSLVDARMLDTLSKKELEKFLGVTRKFHQASIVHGIHVLRIVKYDRQTLAMRRVQSETVDADPIVWTNQRFVRWVRSIDLGEYSDNLKDSGVHGGLVVLEPSFSGETMATALGIPASKNIIRRHLCTEFDALILPARATLGQGIRSGCGIVPITGPGGLQHYATTDRRSSGSLRISAWKGSQSSLSKAFRFNAKPLHRNAGDRSSFGNSTSPTPSYSSSEGGGGIYATIGGQQQQQQQQQQTQHYHFLPPPTTAPPPPPSNVNYGPPGHRVSAPPPIGHIDPSIDPSNPMLYDKQLQQRRVKSISDIGVSASQSGGSVGTASLGGISISSNSPV